MELEDYKVKIREAYSYPPENLREKGSVLFFNRYEERRLERHLDLNMEDIVLDACCGYGRWALRIAPRIKKVVAVDFSKAFIEELKNRNIPNIEAVCTDLSKLRYRNYFDVVIFSGGLEHFKDKIATLKHLFNMMKKGGRIYVSCWTSDMLIPLRKHRGARAREMKIENRSWYIDEPSREDLMRIMSLSKFRDIHVEAIYGNTRYLPENTDEAFADYIIFPRKVNVLNIAYAEKP